MHFSPTDYPPPKTNEDTSIDLASSGWVDLCRDLMTAAHSAGNSIICNGSSTVMNKVFMCGTFYQKTRTSAMNVTDDTPYRETLLCNDRMHNRKGGLSYPKRIKTVDCRGCTCKFRFIVKWDTLLGFYVEFKVTQGWSCNSFFPSKADWRHILTTQHLFIKTSSDWRCSPRDEFHFEQWSC